MRVGLQEREIARVLGLTCAFAIAGASGGCEPAKAPPVPTVSLRLQGTPPDATVIIDDENLGPLAFVASRGVALPPGVHHVSVVAPGYLPWDKAVEAKPGGALIRLEIALVPVPD
jgi:hypothetical protein